MKQKLRSINWQEVLTGEADHDSEILTSHIISLQREYVPHRLYSTKPEDQPWFGYRCRLAAEAKYKAWTRLKKHPTRRNKHLHQAACKEMKNTVKWAMSKWETDIKRKLRGNKIGTKQWWSLIKEKQGLLTPERIPPLHKTDRTLASTSREKAELLASMFSKKMTVQDPDRHPPALPHLCTERLESISITEIQVWNLLKSLNTSKATGPDDISPHILKHCARELALPLKLLFDACLQNKVWPNIWKKARITPVHKKNAKSDPRNYRPISLLSVVSKILEKLIAEQLCKFLDRHHLLSSKQFGFRSGRSTSDLLLLLSKTWNDALDTGHNTLVIALDIAGAFDCVWHQGLLAKLEALGIDGDLLELFADYLTNRSLAVVVNGHTSSSHAIGASVPQGSVLGPIMWNIFFNDLLQGLPSSYAYADDCTLAYTYKRDEAGFVIEEANHQLDYIASWGQRWQVKFASEKTQAMVISRSSNDSTALEGKLVFENDTLDIKSDLSILGVKFDKKLTFELHIREVAHRASLKVTALRRIKHLLDADGLQMLYKAQVRSHLEYAPLTWMSSPRTHLDLLDKVQRRAERLIASSCQQGVSVRRLDSLQHRRQVASLTVMHKAQVQHVPHLASLRLPWRRSLHSTRSALSSDCLVEVPRSHTSTHLRTFTATTSRLWNSLTADTTVWGLTTHQMKLAANTWSRHHRPNLYY